VKTVSLGWGIQSTCLAVMSALGDIDCVDYAIHSDTNYESSLTYEYANRWTPWFVEHGINIVTVQNVKPNEIITDRVGGEIFIPAFTNTPSSNGGQLRRQCTRRWKIAPIRRWLQTNRNKEPVEMWIGISTDEALRMRPSGVKYITNRWPLIELGMSRKDCGRWLQNHGIEVPPKSSCVFCPYHNTAEWRATKVIESDWNKVVELDKRIRKVRPPYDLFVHPSRRPIKDVDFRTMEQKGQIRLWDDECTGICGV
jgi:hypothetical protein